MWEPQDTESSMRRMRNTFTCRCGTRYPDGRGRISHRHSATPAHDSLGPPLDRGAGTSSQRSSYRQQKHSSACPGRPSGTHRRRLRRSPHPSCSSRRSRAVRQWSRPDLDRRVSACTGSTQRDQGRAEPGPQSGTVRPGRLDALHDPSGGRAGVDRPGRHPGGAASLRSKSKPAPASTSPILPVSERCAPVSVSVSRRPWCCIPVH